MNRLVYYESFAYPDAAIDHEMELKGWRRDKKIRLIESQNPKWDDLAQKWTNICKPDGPSPQQIPRAAEERRPSG